jgi:hypothetical protein
MESKQRSMLDLICETHVGLERQGHGSPEMTIKALRFLDNLELIRNKAGMKRGQVSPGKLCQCQIVPCFYGEPHEWHPPSAALHTVLLLFPLFPGSEVEDVPAGGLSVSALILVSCGTFAFRPAGAQLTDLSSSLVTGHYYSFYTLFRLFLFSGKF